MKRLKLRRWGRGATLITALGASISWSALTQVEVTIMHEINVLYSELNKVKDT